MLFGKFQRNYYNREIAPMQSFNAIHVCHFYLSVTVSHILYISFQALWTVDTKMITDQQHEEFYQFLSHNNYDKPRYTLHYKTDAPISIRSLFYIPSRAPAMWEFSQTHGSGV